MNSKNTYLAVNILRTIHHNSQYGTISSKKISIICQCSLKTINEIVFELNKYGFTKYVNDDRDLIDTKLCKKGKDITSIIQHSELCERIKDEIKSKKLSLTPNELLNLSIKIKYNK